MKSFYIQNAFTGLNVVIMLLILSSTAAYGQYIVGETISQTTRERAVAYCAGEPGNETLGNLLIPAEGEPTRVLWLNFFASW